MMRLAIILAICLLSLQTVAQQVKGTIVRVDKCEFLSEGGFKVNTSSFPRFCYMTLTNDRVVFRGEMHGGFKLYDRKIDTFDNALVLSYFTYTKKTNYIVLAKECENGFQLAIFPFGEGNKFTQYTIKTQSAKRPY